MAEFARGRETEEVFDIEAWQPKTELGRKVKAREIASIDEIFEMGKPILEHQIVDALLPGMKEDVLEIRNTQRMTDCGRKAQFRAVVLVGDGNGHVGIGVGKAGEMRPAIETAVKYAKRNITRIPLGCGSWECGCGTRHSVPISVSGKSGSVHIKIKPAPRGLGLAASEVVKKVLRAVGITDAWSFTRGKTGAVHNTAFATLDALETLNRMKFKGDWETRLRETGEQMRVEKAEAPGGANAE